MCNGHGECDDSLNGTGFCSCEVIKLSLSLENLSSEFQPGLTRSSLYSHRRWLDASNMRCRNTI